MFGDGVFKDVIKSSLVAQTVKNLPEMQETWVQSLVREEPLEKGMAHAREFPGSPMVRTLCFHCRKHRFYPWSGN